MSDQEPLAYSIAETAQLLGISETLLRMQIRAGRVPVTRLGRRVLISPGVIKRLLHGEDAGPAETGAGLRAVK